MNSLSLAADSKVVEIDVAKQPGVSVKAHATDEETKGHIRGSSLLLFGRLLALAINLAVQVLIVRYLSKSDYGAFAYALSVIAMGSSIAVFGLDKSVSRFVSIFHEQRDYRRMAGTIVLVVGTILSLGLAIVLFALGLQDPIRQSFNIDRRAMTLILTLIVLAPIFALESIFTSMFAIFAKPQAIFFRKYLLGPTLTLIVVLLIIQSRSNVYFLARGYLLVGIFSVTLYATVLFNVLRQAGLLRHFNRRTIQIPGREIFGFTLPLLVSDLVVVLRTSGVVVLLEHFHTTTDVASFRAVLPIAQLNMVVYQNFTFLFMPLASRMFARSDGEGINNLYWQTAIWIAVFSFPVFAVASTLSKPLTVLLFGERYANSALILMLLSLGFYFNAAFGFNGLVLRVFKKVRYIFLIDLLMAATCLGASLWLIPRYGAVGAAISTSGTFIAQNILYQLGLTRGTDVKWPAWSYFKVYIIIGLCVAGLLLLPQGKIGFAAAAWVIALVFWLNRDSLRIGHTFPELLRFPLVGRIFGK
jgi:O-antigen/teichoic acid export membrane protein